MSYLFSWPEALPLKSNPARHLSDSIHTKSLALSFFAQLDSGDDHDRSPQLPNQAPPTQEQLVQLGRQQQQRKTGDVHTQYVRALHNKVNNKPHRIFLSWDRAYPSLVFSLVSDQGRPKPQTVFRKPTATLRAPEDAKSKLDIAEPEEVSSYVFRQFSFCQILSCDVLLLWNLAVHVIVCDLMSLGVT
jgi:hypothetical protein